jgi:hypothetical protein
VRYRVIRRLAYVVNGDARVLCVLEPGTVVAAALAGAVSPLEWAELSGMTERDRRAGKIGPDGYVWFVARGQVRTAVVGRDVEPIGGDCDG